MMPALAVRGTILVATLAWMAAEWLQLRRPHRWPAARLLWTAGALLTAGHMVAALHFVHGWSHDAAIAATAQQTAAVTGLDWGGGLYINYLFVALWLWDASMWWISPDGYRNRPWIQATVLRGVFLFIFVNGAIVFARGPGRMIGIVAVTAVIWAWYRRRVKSSEA